MLPWIVLTSGVLGVVFGQFYYKRYSMAKDRRWLVIGLIGSFLHSSCSESLCMPGSYPSGPHGRIHATGRPQRVMVPVVSLMY